MAGWHHRLYGHEFEQAPGVGNGQGGLACCGPWGHKESDTPERLNTATPSCATFQQDDETLYRCVFTQLRGHAGPCHDALTGRPFPRLPYL